MLYQIPPPIHILQPTIKFAGWKTRGNLASICIIDQLSFIAHIELFNVISVRSNL